MEVFEIDDMLVEIINDYIDFEVLFIFLIVRLEFVVILFLFYSFLLKWLLV